MYEVEDSSYPNRPLTKAELHEWARLWDIDWIDSREPKPEPEPDRQIVL